MTLWRLEGDTLPEESRGQVIPEYYGRLHRDIPGYPLQVGYAATLADNCGATTGQTTLLLSGAHLDLIQTALALPVVAQLDNEWVRVTAFLGGASPSDPWRLTVTRAYGGTTAALHAKGATVNFLESRCVYVFASAPDGCRYPDDAVVQVRLNDVAQMPPCTVRLQDTRWIPGARLVTVEYDLTRYFGGAAPAADRATALLVPPPLGSRTGGTWETVGAPRERSVHELPVSTRTDFLVGASSATGLGQVGYSGGATHVHEYIAAPSAPAPLANGAGITPAVLQLLPPLLGRVTMDLRGLLDTPAGRYTGTGAAPLLDPVSQVQCILESTYGESDRYQPAWDTTRASLAAGTPITTRIAWRGADFEAFRALAGFHGLGDLWLDDDGHWRYTATDGTIRPTVTVTPREIIGEVSLGFIPPSATSLVVIWGVGIDGGTLTLDSPPMIDRFDTITDRALALPWAETEPVARRIATAWAPQWDRDRWTATVAVAPCLAALSRTDRIWLETPLLTPYGLGQRPWQIRGTADRGDQRVLTLVECDALFVALAGSLLGRATVTGSIMPTTLSGAAIARATVVGALTAGHQLAGTLFGAATVTGSLTSTAALLGGALTGTALLGGTLLAAGTPLALEDGTDLLLEDGTGFLLEG